MGTDAELFIVDSAADGVTIDLLEGRNGYTLNDWRPALPQYKGRGTFADSPLFDYRRITDYHWQSTIETLTFTVRGSSRDDAIYQMQELMRLLQKGVDYWVSPRVNNDEFVYIQARANCESERRYAVISNWRIDEVNNPYSAPFIQEKGESAYVEIVLTLEHTHWQSTVPGTGDCLNLTASLPRCDLYTIEKYDTFKTTGIVRVAPPAAPLNGLASSAFTAEGYFRCDSIDVIGGEFVLIAKGGGTNYVWIIKINVDGSLEAEVTTDGTHAISISSGVDYIDGEFHHFAMTYDNAGTREIRLWADGNEVSYDTQQAATGTVDSDTGSQNLDLLLRHGIGQMGWARISDSVRYSSAFTPDEQCDPPSVDGNTVWQINLEEGFGFDIDNAEGTSANDAEIDTINSGWWADCICSRTLANQFYNSETGEYESAGTCEGAGAFILNGRGGQLTHIFVFNAGTASFGSNLLDGNPPYALFPDPADTDDIVYFGIESGDNNSGPILSLVLDFINEFDGSVSVVWEIWNGATWAPGSNLDETDTFHDGGVSLVVTVYSDDTTTVNGVSGYWVRARISAATAATPVPTQQNSHVYNPSWPFVEVNEEDIGGDINAFVKHIYSSSNMATSSDGAGNSIILAALRSLDRGPDYTPIINLSPTGNPGKITITNGADTTAFAGPFLGGAASVVPELYQTDFSGTTGLVNRITVGIRNTNDYNGRFRVLLRVLSESTPAVDVHQIQVIASVVTNFRSITFFQSDIAIPGVKFPGIIDMGVLEYPPPAIKSSENFENISINLLAGLTDAAVVRDLLWMELILWPVDEWSALYSNALPRFSTSDPETFNILDAVSSPAEPMRSVAKVDGGPIITSLNPVAAAPPQIHANRNQRIYFLGYGARDPDITNDNLNEINYSTAELNSEKAQRYLQARGNR